MIESNKEIRKSKIAPSTCTVFIQVWVDVNMLYTNNPEKGCYVVDNRSKYSEFEGTDQLQTCVVSGSKICWSILPVDPQYNGKLIITSINVEFAYNDPPLPYDDNLNIWTGIAAVTLTLKSIPGNLTFSYNDSSLSRTVVLPICVRPSTSGC
ncbi:hypothetical protein PQ462_21135 [Flavobacterium sp. KACC 22758]|uniref:hypothetical protein n=1 Tax=Flavobacterium sp. KACC 22758 TaxID=3025667 RepID=UPI00236507E3|nr:hypothetical protein [Flavobacterium sp. KACC 22758]WDF59207.1 hypothetical protein PQ462_21135 [Flavobacterium sp. KACC 22758]